MTESFLLLGACQLVFLALYRWVSKRYIFAPSHEHPAIFWNRSIATTLCTIPTLGVLGTIVGAFFVTESPWSFLALSFIGFILFSIGLQSKPASVDEAYYWLTQHNIDTDRVRYSTYTDLARTKGATVVVGIGIAGQNRKLGFAVEILPGRGVIRGEIIEPYGIVTHHKVAARAARQHDMCLIDALLFLAKQHQTQQNK